MASLDNFHTGRATTTTPLFPDRRIRMDALGKAVHQPRAWDIPNEVPVPVLNPSQQYHVPHHPEPRFTEPKDRQGKSMLVPVPPYTRGGRGATSESLLLMPGKACPFRSWWQRLSSGGIRLPHTQAIRYRPY